MIAKTFFAHGESRARLWIGALLVAMFIAVVLILLGVIAMGREVRTLAKYIEVSQQRWNALSIANPDISVPKMVDGKIPQIIIQEKPEPSPTPTPTSTPAPTPSPLPTQRPQAKTRTVVRYRKQTTPKPFFDFFKSTR